MEQNTLLHSSQLSIAVINIILYYNDYCPAYTDTVGWLSVATNTMTHRLRTSNKNKNFIIFNLIGPDTHMRCMFLQGVLKYPCNEVI